MKGWIGRCGARLVYIHVEALTKQTGTKLSGLGSRASGKPRGAGRVKETKA